MYAQIMVKVGHLHPAVITILIRLEGPREERRATHVRLQGMNRAQRAMIP